MFKVINVINTDETTEPKAFKIDGVNYVDIRVDRYTLELIKRAMIILNDRSTDTKYFDPKDDKKTIELIQQGNEDIRVAYDIASVTY